MAKCIYCSKDIYLIESEKKADEVEGSREHIFPDHLGCPVELNKDLVCKNCNGLFNDELHLPFREIVLRALINLDIRSSKTNAPPSREVELTVDGEKTKLKVRPDGITPLHPKRTVLPDGSIDVLARSEADRDKMYKEIIRKNPGFVVRRQEKISKYIDEVEEFYLPIKRDFLRRYFAQIAMNCLAYWFGRQVLTKPGIINIRDIAINKSDLQICCLTYTFRDHVIESICFNSDPKPIISAMLVIKNNTAIIRMDIFAIIACDILISDMVGLTEKQLVINSHLRKIIYQK